MGLIVLRVDETIEEDFHQLIDATTARLHVTRIRSGDHLTRETIAEMGPQLAGAANLLPPAAGFSVVGYACTSGAALLGTERVAANIRAGVSTQHVTDPLSAAVARIASLELGRIGIVSPYLAPVAEGLCAAFAAHGVPVVASHSLNEDVEANVARLDPNLVATAARQLADSANLDGIFLSCTNLQTLGIIAPLSRALSLPVLSSNQVLAWHMRVLAKVSSGKD